uniref:Uncharacterized protein n=1 Tax=Anguilla anguilla TaxID=7936 RepID=A0A0E9SFI7_ANGAN
MTMVAGDWPLQIGMGDAQPLWCHIYEEKSAI